MKNAIKFMAGLLFAITVALGYQVQPASAQYVCDFTDNPKCQVSLHSGERLDMIWQPHKTLIGSMINDSNSSAEVVWQIASPPQPVTLFEGDYYPIEAETLFSTNGFIENDSTDDTVVLVYLQKSSR